MPAININSVHQPGASIKRNGIMESGDDVFEIETAPPFAANIPPPTHDPASANFQRWLAALKNGSAWEHALAYRVTADEAHRTLAISKADAIVTTDTVAGNQYLAAGRQYRDVFSTLAWCEPEQSDAWLAWGKRHLGATDGSIEKSIWWTNRWSRNNPANNYFHAFIQATSYYVMASGDAEWTAFLKSDRFEKLRTYYATTPEGGSREGTAYGESHRTLLELAKLWRDFDGTEILPQEFIDGSLLYWTHATTPGHEWVALIGDQTRTHGRTDGYHRHIIGAALALAKDGQAIATGRWQLGKLAPSTNPIFYPLELVDHPAHDSPPAALEYHAKGVGHYFRRTDWTATAAYLVCVAGPYDEAHAQQDQGSFALFAAGRWQTCSDSPWTHGGIEQGTDFQNVIRFGVPQKQKTTGTLVVTGDVIDMDLSAPAQQPWKRRIYWTGKSPLVIRDWCNPAATFGFCVPSEDDTREPYVSTATATVGRTDDGFISIVEF